MRTRVQEAEGPFEAGMGKEVLTSYQLHGQVLPPQKKGGGVGWGRTARQGKRDKCRYEVECVTDVPIGCILNR